MIKQLKKQQKSIVDITTKKDWVVDTTISPDIYVSSSIFPILKGKKLNGYFYPTSSRYYNANNDGLNWDGSYKSLIYNREYSMFYKNVGNPNSNFGVFNYQKEVRNIQDEITSIHIPKNRYGERIIPNSLYIKDYSNPELVIEAVDDGNSNIIASGSVLKTVDIITGSIEIDELIYNNIAIYKNSSGSIITKEESINLYKAGQEVYVETSSDSYLPKNKNKEYYDPTFERFGNSIDTYGDYILVSSIMDENSFSSAKNGTVCLFTKENNEYKQIKTFKSPFSQRSLSLENSEYNIITTEYGDFILYEDSGELCGFSGVSGSSRVDNYGISIAINKKHCAISSTGYDKCSNTTCESGSGLVFCYQEDKGGQDNWGIINVLEGENYQDKFGYSVSIGGDIMAIGAPGYDGTGSVYVYRLKRYMSNGCDYIPTSSIIGSASLSDWSGSLVYGTGSSGTFELNSVDLKQNFWYPMDSKCLSRIASDLYEPIVSDNSFEFLVADSFNNTGFSDFSLVPEFVSGSFSWQLEVMIVGPHAGSGFGGCLEVDNGKVLIGNNILSPSSSAWLYVSSASYSGSCPTYSWKLSSTLERTDGDIFEDLPAGLNGKNNGSGYGNSVSIRGEYMCVGCPYDRLVSGYTLGTSTIYKYSNFVNSCGSASLYAKPIQKIIPSILESEQSDFGYSCNISEKYLVVGAPAAKSKTTNLVSINSSSHFYVDDYYSTGSIDSSIGKAYVYELVDGIFSEVLPANLSKEYANTKKSFGNSVSISNLNIFVGAPALSIKDTASLYYNSSLYYDQSVLVESSSWENNCGKTLFGEIFNFQLNPDTLIYIGNIFYNTGTIVITNTSSIYKDILSGVNERGFYVTYKGQQTLQESEYIVNVDIGEFNVSTNPTAVKGRLPLIDVNSDNTIDFNDINIILKYINGDVAVADTESVQSLLEIENSKSWWKNDLIISEAEDAIIANGLLVNLNNDKSVLTTTRHSYITNNLINTGILDINGDGFVDAYDAKLLWNYWLGKLSVDIIDTCIPEGSTRIYLNDILEYIKKIMGRTSPYPTKKQSEILHPTSSGSVYSENNGGLSNEYFKNYSVSSSLDPTGSYLSTYITGIGLYVGGDLVMVGKLGTPIKNIIDYPLNFSIKFDAF